MYLCGPQKRSATLSDSFIHPTALTHLLEPLRHRLQRSVTSLNVRCTSVLPCKGFEILVICLVNYLLLRRQRRPTLQANWQNPHTKPVTIPSKLRVHVKQAKDKDLAGSLLL